MKCTTVLKGFGGEIVHNVGIIVNFSKDKELKVTEAILQWMEARGVNVLLTEKASLILKRPECKCAPDEMYRNSDFIIVLGGDGTILSAAREVAEFETPLLGVNMGHLGFLAEVEVCDLFKSLETIFVHGIKVEKRLMLQSSVCKNNKCREFFALNDIAITRGTLSRIISLNVFIDNDFVTAVKGDGLILASPTGSTAYSLSAGGPIVSPSLSVITITPICPHSLYSRSIVVSGDEIIRVDLKVGSGDAYLTIDGQEGYKLIEGENVTISRASFSTNLIKVSDNSFYDVLRNKLTEK